MLHILIVIMPQHKRGIYILFLFLIFFNFIPIALAENEPISISLDCLESCKGQTLNYSNNILFELTIKNNLDYWASIEGGRDGASLYVTVSNDKLNYGKDYEIYGNILGQTFFIKPRDIIKVYIPFKMYNDKFKDNRLGDWRLSPKLSFGIVKFYRNPSDLNNIYDAPIVNSPITGNDLKFEIEKPETKVQADKSSVVSQGYLDKIINYIKLNLIVSIIIALIVTIIGGLIVNYISHKYITNK